MGFGDLFIKVVVRPVYIYAVASYLATGLVVFADFCGVNTPSKPISSFSVTSLPTELGKLYTIIYYLHHINTVDINNPESRVMANCGGNHWEMMGFEYLLFVFLVYLFTCKFILFNF